MKNSVNSILGDERLKACSQRSEIGTSKEVFHLQQQKKKEYLGINVTKRRQTFKIKTIKQC